ncbi:hypothetical protein M406DRAFT_108355 [Cryphonectria parasitica EP155]|uniref:Uncharacterized protein n=1 Tax=Cryphonectria parasitica (strain ATCC 38755 / EP155) TaxID=660469 RepID=A0A9P5CKB8_CRYP1|nr:uncharacterized protein M406DRAFT_108355 [Cryphonectria parasitica EP155]KAF3761027.1 hypothetical protein M406DRAFT_108355 [Cryphonectria parasitica EP155]
MTFQEPSRDVRGWKELPDPTTNPLGHFDDTRTTNERGRLYRWACSILCQGSLEMASGWFGGRSIELIKARSLLVKVLPTPATLSERRAVLHALQRHGPIEVFKRLTEHNTFVCAPTRTDVANELIKASPLRFRFVSEPLQSIRAKSAPGAEPVDIAAPIEIHESEHGYSHDPADHTSPESTTTSDPITNFTMYIHPSQSYYEHRTAIRLNPIHGRWPKTLEEDQDFVYSALKKVVPRNVAQNGLCDWQTGGQLMEDAKLIRTSQTAGKLWHIMERRMRRQNRAEQGEAENELVLWTSLDEAKMRRDEEWHRALQAKKEVAGPRPKTDPAPVDTGASPELTIASDAQQPAAEILPSSTPAEALHADASNSVTPAMAPETSTEESGARQPKTQAAPVGTDLGSPMKPWPTIHKERNKTNTARPSTKKPPNTIGASGWNRRTRKAIDASALRVHYWARESIPVGGPVRWKRIPLNADAVDDKPFSLETFQPVRGTPDGDSPQPTALEWKALDIKQQQEDKESLSSSDLPPVDGKR